MGFGVDLFIRARLPQIYKNYCDKSCEGEYFPNRYFMEHLLTWTSGLSLLFFILSLLGNLTYGAGVRIHTTYGFLLQ